MRIQPLTRSGSVTLNGSGNGTVQLGPSHANEQWQPSIVSVSCSQAVTTGTCQCQIYCGPAATQAYFVDGTFSGDTGDSSNAVAGQILWPGTYVFAVFTGGVAGAVATVMVQGTRQVP